MVYVLPQVQVFQEFTTATSPAARTLNAHLAGGHAYLLRFTEAAEKELGFLGFYDSLADQCYDWPDLPPGAIVDDSYVQVWVENALLQYFQDLAGGGYGTQTVVSGYQNRILSSAVNFRANGDDYPRDDSLLDRDVQVGDIVHVRAVVSAVVYDLWTYVAGFVANRTAAAVASATSDSNNAGTQGASSASHSQTAGPVNCVDILSVNQSSYNGLATGDINETYTITVIGSSTGGDFTTARLRVTSLSGNDDVASVTPAASNSPTTIGTRGATVTFKFTAGGACSISADDAGVTENDLIEGQEWEVTVHQAFTAPTPTSGGTYNGDADTTYIVEVSRGGRYADSQQPQITVTTNDGSDISGPTTVTATNTAVPIGTQGATIKFSDTALCQGDRYYVICTASTNGPIRTLILGNNLDSNVIAGTDCDITLYIAKTVQLSQNRTGFAPAVNWSTTATQLCVETGAIAYDPTWTDEGVPQPLNVTSNSAQGFGRVYVQYRAWRQDLVGIVGSIADIGDLTSLVPGPITPDNPLSYGLSKALQNCNGTPVSYSAVQDPNDPESWVTMLGTLEGRPDVYNLVPLTYDRTVLNAYQAHVDDQSGASQNSFRVAFFGLENPPTTALVSAATSKNQGVVMATLADDPQTAGTQYTLLSVPAANSQFVTNGVRAGDIVRFLYTSDGFGNSTYSEFVVEAVVNEDQLRLADGADAAVSVAQKMEVWRNLNASEQAAQIAASAGAWADRRIRAVWPDTIGDGGLSVPGYHLCAALAGLVSGVVPHQGLTELQVKGFDDVSRTTRLFSRAQLDSMAAAGVWIVTQDPRTGTIYSRHALTTGPYADVNQREEEITRNVDSISFQFFDTYAPYIGVSNVTPSMEGILRAETLSTIQFLRNANFTPRLGAQLIDATIDQLYASPTLKDTYVVQLSLQLPYPLNNIQLTLFV